MEKELTSRRKIQEFELVESPNPDIQCVFKSTKTDKVCWKRNRRLVYFGGKMHLVRGEVIDPAIENLLEEGRGKRCGLKQNNPFWIV